MLQQPSGAQTILVASVTLFQGVVSCWVYLASVLDDWGRRHGMILTEERLTYTEKNMCQCHSVYNKSHMDWRGYWARAFAMRGRPLTARFKTISSFFLSYSDLFYLLTAGSDSYCCTWSCSMTQTHTHSVRLLWTSDRPTAETSTWQHTTLTQTSMPPAVFDPTISASERPQTHALE